MLKNINHVDSAFKTVNRIKTGFKTIFSKSRKFYGKRDKIPARNSRPKTGGRKARRSGYLGRARQPNACTQTEKTFEDPGTSNGQAGQESLAKTLGVLCGKMLKSGLQCA
eukprot:TRINITY_DN13912_c0_g1_i1.p1 TRINITY_DN13912_c0_g1~~TRINITY_DN13912_c0_g1_i1.p1  ORF type:complete len:110 (+),score=4.76 TRINITY_DN13912_c0_g1_i1:172-501(+)